MSGRLVAVAGLADVAALEDYPIGRDERLDGNAFVKWHVHRWLASRTFKLMGWAEQGMARALFDLCQTESPVGTLPDDDGELAFMLRVDLRRLREMRAMEFGPLRNWHRVRCGDEVRLAHPVVLEQVRDALERREMAKLSKEEQATAKRLARLEKALLENGCSKDVVADQILLQRMDAWLAQAHRGNRTKAVYRSVILHAVQSGWMMPGAWEDRG